MPTKKSFTLAKVSSPKKGYSYVDCGYYFSFKAEDTIPDYGEVILTFPEGYSLLSSYPKPTFSAP